jgi:putative transposase
MTTAKKLALVAAVVAEYPLDVVLSAVDLPRSTWYYHQSEDRSYGAKYADLRQPLEEIAREMPEYGYRRATPELRDRVGQVINDKVVRRLNRLWGLNLVHGTRRVKPGGVYEAIVAAGDRANLVAQLDQAQIDPFEVLYTDFSEIVYDGGRRKAYLIVLLDHASKVVPGWALGAGPTTETALKAWAMTKRTLAEHGVSIGGMVVHQDQGSAFISYSWTGQLLLDDKVNISYSLDGAKGNTYMESFFGRFKEENEDVLDAAESYGDLISVLTERIAFHCQGRRHSSLGYLSPAEYLSQRGFAGWHESDNKA